MPAGYAYGLFPSEAEATRAAAHATAGAHAVLAAGAAAPPEFARCSLREMLFVCNKMQHQAHAAMAGGGGAGIAGFAPLAAHSPYAHQAPGAIGAEVPPGAYGALGYGVG